MKPLVDTVSPKANSQGQGKSSSTEAEAIKKQTSVMTRLRKRPARRSSRSASAPATTPSVRGMVSFTSFSHHGRATVPQRAIKILTLYSQLLFHV
ncbi:Uncharacterised protein [Enterobacter cloacae]|nr:Uncharacterised protein [Enterobacter cloacae]